MQKLPMGKRGSKDAMSQCGQAHFGKVFWDTIAIAFTFPIVSLPGNVEHPGLEQRGLLLLLAEDGTQGACFSGGKY